VHVGGRGKRTSPFTRGKPLILDALFWGLRRGERGGEMLSEEPQHKGKEKKIAGEKSISSDLGGPTGKKKKGEGRPNSFTDTIG